MRIEKKFFAGTHRGTTPDDTLKRLEPDFGRFGITRIGRLTDLDRVGIEVFTVVRPNCRGLSVTQGKGTTVLSAKLSGVMEAIEYWHAERPEIPLCFASYSELVRKNGLESALCAPGIPSNDAPLLWTSATDLTSGSRISVPFDLVHANFLAASRPRQSGIPVSTNGLASGGELTEALTHAICEVIERHATAFFGSALAEFRDKRILALDSVDDTEARDLLEKCRHAGVAVKIWDSTSHISVPCFLACLADIKDQRMPPGFGSGCHPSRAIALSRAICEAAQSRLTRISGARDDLDPKFYGATEGARARFLVESGNVRSDGNMRRFNDSPNLSSDCLVADLWRVVQALATAGKHQVLALSLADDPRYSVVRVIVPGLLGLEARP